VNVYRKRVQIGVGLKEEQVQSFMRFVRNNDQVNHFARNE